MVPVETDQLIAAAKGGDPEAQKQLIEHWQKDVFRFLAYLCGDPTWAEDLAQETWIRALAHLEKLKDSQKFKAWVLTIARNEYRMALRRRREVTGFEAAFWEKALENQLPRPDDAMATLQALGGLEVEAREALVLVDVEGYSYFQAAGIIGISENALRSRLHRARKKFEQS